MSGIWIPPKFSKKVACFSVIGNKPLQATGKQTTIGIMEWRSLLGQNLDRSPA